MTGSREDVHVAPDGGPHRNADLASVVDEMEERVIRERRDDDVDGNVDDRRDTDPIIADDDAPD